MYTFIDRITKSSLTCLFMMIQNSLWCWNSSVFVVAKLILKVSWFLVSWLDVSWMSHYNDNNMALLITCFFYLVVSNRYPNLSTLLLKVSSFPLPTR